MEDNNMKNIWYSSMKNFMFFKVYCGILT